MLTLLAASASSALRQAEPQSNQYLPHMQPRCAVTRQSRPSPKAMTDQVLLLHQQCANWSPLPKFKMLAGGNLTLPESSFGIPFRLSSELVLSADLLCGLCSGINNCTTCVLNVSAWTKGQFMCAYLTHPETLFAQGVTAEQAPAPTRTTPSDAPLWDYSPKWTYCPTKEALHTGEGCKGRIKKADWRADKIGTCFLTVQQATGGGCNPMAATSICITESMTEPLPRL